MVELREITKENYEECLNLNIADSQKNFVSSTVHSLAQAWVYYDTAFPFAIYANNVMVGFIMLGYYEVKGYYTLWKLMIDEKYQNKGYGKKALKLGIDYLVDRFKVKEVYTAYYATNRIARDLYASVGFRETGEIVGNEIGMRLTVSNNGRGEHFSEKVELYLAKPDLTFFEQYNDMMAEWNRSNTQIAPWFLDKPFEHIEDFALFIKMLDDYEHATNLDERFCSTTSYFVIDENNRLIGATSLRHYLTVGGYDTWGHIGYGVRPSERRKGYATRMLKMMLEEAGQKKIYKVLIGCHTSNVFSSKVIENCNGQLENVVADPDDINETISRYWIDNK